MFPLETDVDSLHRSVSLIEVPETFIDQYDLHLAAHGSLGSKAGCMWRAASPRLRSRWRFRVEAKTGGGHRDAGAP